MLFAIVAVVGYFRGWYEVQTTSVGNQSHINVTVNKGIIHADEAKVENGASEIRERSEATLAPSKTPLATP